MSERVRDDETRRWRLQERLARYFDVPLTLLAFGLLALLIIEFGVQPGEPWSSRIEAANLIIWAIFAVAFAVEFAIAPRKLAYLRRNWLSALSVALPVFRVLRTFRALRALRGVRALRGLTLARGVTALGRARRELASYFRQYQFGYLLAVTVLVTLLAAALVYFLERGANTSMTSFGEALWWAAAIVTTVNAQQE
ncbi:MAG TPA: ion transporter, partial [Dehalococcoidia bacterium]|nr:ion transporter [Dehalococcoidia bacterium]